MVEGAGLRVEGLGFRVPKYPEPPKSPFSPILPKLAGSLTPTPEI